MKSVTDLFLKYYCDTFVIDDKLHYVAGRLPTKIGFLKPEEIPITVDFNYIYDFINKYRGSVLLVDDEDYEVR